MTAVVDRVVLDASVYVASCVPAESHHNLAVQLLASMPPDEPIAVPAIFRLEVMSALARRGAPGDLLDVMDALLQSPRFVHVPITPRLLDLAVTIARQIHVRAYDALYVALAQQEMAILVTLDAELADRVRAGWPGVVVHTRAS